MSIQTVPTLQDLAIQSVLCYKVLPIPNLEILNRVLILQLYKEALMGGLRGDGAVLRLGLTPYGVPKED
ncbi:putative PRAME family member 12-like, incomplete match [Sciurus carolinensis]|uniref:PRAME family member 12-like, incomplete match n=1 Tax=Sciurus carolinensis TaxID=30640 RepID=A0AA41N7L2_SCICA|nr:putative PRAME family member 12-like, incomplete match [Sciurus carolinensis]